MSSATRLHRTPRCCCAPPVPSARCRPAAAPCSIAWSPNNGSSDGRRASGQRDSRTWPSAPSATSGRPTSARTGWRPTAGRLRRSAASPRSASRSPPTRSAWSAATSRADAGARAHAGDAALPARRAAGAAAPSGTAGYKGFFYHFLDMKTGPRAGRLRAVDRRHRAAAGRRAVRAGVLRRRRRRRGARSATWSSDLTARVDWRWAQARAADHLAGLEPGERLPAVRLARLQRGDAGLPPGARLADARRSTRAPGRLDRGLPRRLGDRFRPAAPELPAAVRPPVLPRLGRLPRHPRRVHAPARHRLLREQPPRDATRSAPTRSPTRWAGAATAPTSGASPRATARPT